MSVELVETPTPHFIPGYTGYCPQYQYRCGDTYGHTTHKLLLDTSVTHAHQLILSDRSTDTYRIFRPPAHEKELMSARFCEGDVYKQPSVPGYEGFIPRERAKFGQRYTVQVNDAITEFQKQQLNSKEAMNQLIKQVSLQDGKWEPATIADRQQIQTNTKMPLCEVRPEVCGIIRHVVCEEPPLEISSLQKSPLFMETNNKDKYIKSGFAGHIPYGYSTIGKTNLQMTQQNLCDFVADYHRRESTEWAPISIVQPDAQLVIHPTEIYSKHMGQLPNYTGHVPGMIFRYGKTYGQDTIDAKRWLRGDYNM